MTDPLPPDPYDALGVAKDATAEAIKKEYRKLVLKFHPDKVQDESKKQAAADLFHKIQTAYELVGDDKRRHRYDAQCKLAELRREVFHADGGGSRGMPKPRSAGYDMSPEPPRGGDYFFREPDYQPYHGRPVYEERRPSYAEERRPSYVDEYEPPPPRPAARKEADHLPKRPSPRADRGRARGGSSKKENERSTRKEKSKRTDKDTRQERDRKSFNAYVEEEGSESDSDEYARRERRMREEDEERKAREAYHHLERQQREDAHKGVYADDLARKIFERETEARGYMQRATQQQRPERSERLEPERRPEPVRQASSKDKVEYIKRDGHPPIMIRRGSDRAAPKSRDADRRRSPAARESARPTPEIVEEPPTPLAERPEPKRKPPTLSTSKSSPADIRPPFDRQRSHSLQEDFKEERIPQVKRSDTMPASPTADPEPQRRRDSKRKEGSKLRTEIKGGYLTPEPSPEPVQSSHWEPIDYGYADDNEYPTPDGFRTEYREPGPREPREPRKAATRGFARSPSPMKERSRERARTTGSTRRVSPKAAPPPMMPRTTSHTYVFPEGNADSSYKRPAMSRENSARLYGEIPTSRSPRQSQGRWTPDMNNVQYTREPRQEDVRMQSGGYRPRSGERPPSYNRSASAQQSVYVK